LLKNRDCCSIWLFKEVLFQISYRLIDNLIKAVGTYYD
jgi:hypothetical protein